MDYRRMLSKLLSKSEFENIKDSANLWNDQSLFDSLAEFGVIRSFDWKHSDENSIYLFIEERLFSIASLGLDTQNITPSSATELYNDIHPNGKRSFVNFVLKFYDKMLRRYRLRLMTIDKQEDVYNILLVEASDVPKLKRIKSDFWKFREIG